MRNKQGNLAFISKSLRPVNIGLVVTCTQYLGYYLQDDYLEMHGEFFKAPVSDNYWVISNNSGHIETQFGLAKEAYAPDLWLTPIMGNLLEDEEDMYATDNIEDEVHV